MPSLDDAFKAQMENSGASTMMSPAFRRRKMIMWTVRLIVACLLAYFFWEHKWVRVVFWIYVVLAAIGLFAIVAMPILLRRKMEQARAQMEHMASFSDDEETEDGEAIVQE